MLKIHRLMVILLTLGMMATGVSVAGVVGEIPISTTSDEARQLFVKARDLFENMRLDESRELFEKAVAADPDFALAYLYRFLAGMSQNDSQKYLQQAIDHASRVSEGERLLIEAAQFDFSNKDKTSIQTLTTLVTEYPADKRSHYFLGLAYFNCLEVDSAIVALKRSIEIADDFASAYNILGYCYYQKEDYSEAETCFRNYSRLLPKEPNPYDSLGDLYTRMGKHNAAIENYQKALSFNPRFSISHVKIGDNLVFMGQFDRARETYRTAMSLEISPLQKISDMQKIALSYVYEGNVAPAIPEIDRAIEIAIINDLPEKQAEILLWKCNLYYETNQLDQAEQCLNRINALVAEYELSPNAREKLAKTQTYHEAILQAKLDNFTDAFLKAELFKTMIDTVRFPMEAEQYNTLLGALHFERNDYQTARQHLTHGNLNDPKTLYMLAVCESESGNKTKAIQLFKKVAHRNDYGMADSFVRSKALDEEKRLLAGNR
ncbi:MAG: tetratricopeptide repeat protein [Candidatus Zhuqueibacterota bacterium]